VGNIAIATLAFRIGDRKPAGTGGGVQLQPFEGLNHAAGPHGEGFERVNFYGNIALFVPLGMFLAWLLYGWLIGRVALAWLLGATLSASIELTQSTLDRVVEINDIILNSSGAAFGVCRGSPILVFTWLSKSVIGARRRRSSTDVPAAAR